MIKQLKIFGSHVPVRNYLGYVLPSASCRVDQQKAQIEYTDGSVVYCRVVKSVEQCALLYGLWFDSIEFDASCGKINPEMEGALRALLPRTAQLSPADAAPFLQARPLSR